MLKQSDMCSVDMKVLRFADAQESRLQAWKRSYMASEACKLVDLLIVRNIVAGCEMVRYEQCYPARGLIC